MKPKRRTCFLTGEEKSTPRMIRLVLDPEGNVVPDLAEKLPGRGLWITADKQQLTSFLAKKDALKRLAHGFKETAKDAVQLEDKTLSDLIDKLMTKQCLNLLGLEMKKGALSVGFEKVKGALARGKAWALIVASDAQGADGDETLRQMAAHENGASFVVDVFDRDQLGQAIGRENAVYIAWLGSGSKGRFRPEVLRLLAYRGKAVSNIAISG
jgi:hypothetical protein